MTVFWELIIGKIKSLTVPMISLSIRQSVTFYLNDYQEWLLVVSYLQLLDGQRLATQLSIVQIQFWWSLWHSGQEDTPRQAVPVVNRVTICIWRLASNLEYRSISHLFAFMISITQHYHSRGCNRLSMDGHKCGEPGKVHDAACLSSLSSLYDLSQCKNSFTSLCKAVKHLRGQCASSSVRRFSLSLYYHGW